MSGDAEYGLVMPFVTVASKGGPHDDESYVAGYAMGLLDARLSVGGDQEPATVRTSCVRQADLLALRYGYTAQFEASDVEGWSTATFTAVEITVTPPPQA